MAKQQGFYEAVQRARFMRPDAARYIRPDAARFLKPGTNPADVYPALALKYSPTQRRIPRGQTGGGRWTDEQGGEPSGGGTPTASMTGDAEGVVGEFDDPTEMENYDNAGDISEIELPSEFGTTTGDTVGDYPSSESADDPTTSNEYQRPEYIEENYKERYDDRLASADKPSLDRVTMFGILARAAARVIEAYRSANNLFDLFGHSDGAVAYTTVDDKDIFGSNSTSPTYTSADFTAAANLRNNLIAKYPSVMSVENPGSAPNNAVFHAEANVVVRAAQASGGSLAGRSLDVYVDRDLCGNCRSVLPLIGLEFGNPTLTFIDPRTIYVIKDGVITFRSRR